MPLHLEGCFVRAIPEIQYNEEKEEWEIVEEEDEEVEGKWQYLFVDLVFVALISKFSQVMERCALSFHSLSFVSIMMTTMFVTRLYLDDYCNRFFVNDLFHRFLYFAYTMAMFVMSLNINADPAGQGLDSDAHCSANIYGPGFPAAFIASRGIIMALYLTLVFSDSKCFYQYIGPTLRTLLSMLLVMALVAEEDAARASGGRSTFTAEYRMYIYLCGVIVEVTHTLATYLFKALDRAGYHIDQWGAGGTALWKALSGAEYYMLDLDAYKDRIGAFLMMILGESVINLILPYMDQRDADETYKFTCISCFIIFLYGLDYFDAANTKDGGEHALTHSLYTNFCYTYIHLPLAFGMFFTSAGMSRCYELSKELMEEARRRVEGGGKGPGAGAGEGGAGAGAGEGVGAGAGAPTRPPTSDGLGPGWSLARLAETLQTYTQSHYSPHYDTHYSTNANPYTRTYTHVYAPLHGALPEPGGPLTVPAHAFSRHLRGSLLAAPPHWGPMPRDYLHTPASRWLQEAEGSPSEGEGAGTGAGVGAGGGEGAGGGVAAVIAAPSWDHRAMLDGPQLLAASIGFTIVFLAVLRQLHCGLGRMLQPGERRRLCEFLMKVFFGAIHWSVPSYGFEQPSFNAFTHACFLLVMIVVETRWGKKTGPDGEPRRTHTRKAEVSALVSKRDKEEAAGAGIAATAAGKAKMSAFASRFVGLKERKSTARPSLSERVSDAEEKRERRSSLLEQQHQQQQKELKQEKQRGSIVGSSEAGQDGKIDSRGGAAAAEGSDKSSDKSSATRVSGARAVGQASRPPLSSSQGNVQGEGQVEMVDNPIQQGKRESRRLSRSAGVEQ